MERSERVNGRGGDTATSVAASCVGAVGLDADTAVVGAGVVGIAAARALARSGREVLMLEREATFGTATSARNSEVIHAGIYYPSGSLKASLCVAGRRALYRYCEGRGVAHRRCGKLIVAASDAELATLDAVSRRARANGVEDLERLDASAVAALEPAIRARAAVHSPSTGIVDSHALMLSLLGEAEAAGAVLAVRAPVESARLGPDGLWRVAVGGEAPAVLHVRELVNAAGLEACALAADDPGAPAPRYARGVYFALRGRAPTTRLIYPVPEPGGLGVHLTLDLAGRARFGPDVEWIDAPDYAVDPARAARFYGAVRRYWPALPDDALVPDYAGVRPKVAVGEAVGEDFAVRGPAEHGRPGRVDLLGVESPGLTACLALGELVVRALEAPHVEVARAAASVLAHEATARAGSAR